MVSGMVHRYLVYGLPRGEGQRREPSALASRASVELVCRLFCDDAPRRTLFLSFLRQGIRGVLLHEGDVWQTYAWISRPSTAGPGHLPRWAGRLGAHWIFYCRTREDFRGRGLYGAAMDRLVAMARAEDPAAPVYIDTSRRNTASRRAILRAGFSPHGEALVLDLPGIRPRGIWLREREHPGLR